MAFESAFWRAVKERSASALAAGALHPIGTTSTVIEDGGVRFVTRVVENLERKRLEGVMKGSDRIGEAEEHDPFLEPEEALVVGDVSDTHYALLNKYNVVDHHVLLVTRAFEDQESLLTVSDFDAVWRCLEQEDALVFYNAGSIAGASQRHKHLQMVPVPLGPGPERVPVEPLVAAELSGDGSGLPFRHALRATSGESVATRSHELYLELLDSVGRPKAYNLLQTRDWMMVVPRARPSWSDISVNALGFAGALLVRSDEELLRLSHVGPMRLLREVAENV